MGAYGAGRVVPRFLVLASLLVVLCWSAWWHGSGRVRFPGDRDRVQANKKLAQSGPGGTMYFGALLGFGFATRMATPLWYAIPLMGASGSVQSALALGVGVGLGRSWPAARAVAGRDRGGKGLVARALDIAERHRADSFQAIVAIVLVIVALAYVPA